MTDAELREIAEGLAELSLRRTNGKLGITPKVSEAMSRILRAIELGEELLKRVTSLEKRPELKHVGTWKEGKRYQRSNLLTDKGALWLCKRNTKERPGQSAAWQLIVKSGGAT